MGSINLKLLPLYHKTNLGNTKIWTWGSWVISANVTSTLRLFASCPSKTPQQRFRVRILTFSSLFHRASYARHDSPSWTFSRAFGKLVANELMSFTFCCCSSSSESLSPFRSASKLIQVELFPNLYIFDQTANGFLNVCFVSELIATSVLFLPRRIPGAPTLVRIFKCLKNDPKWDLLLRLSYQVCHRVLVEYL